MTLRLWIPPPPQPPVEGEGFRLYADQVGRRLAEELILQREARLRAFLRAARTHRLNVVMEVDVIPKLDYSPLGRPYLEQEVRFHLLKPRGWVAPLP